ncbi:hypothetical protein AURDEDRAFT_172639 [Auricularia subglabra TFB-10046 SS5]|nr:hypothetical protein AURDEDRAFT_172639 [Auricularia subglabra TFB-10046 SS5]
MTTEVEELQRRVVQLEQELALARLEAHNTNTQLQSTRVIASVRSVRTRLEADNGAGQSILDALKKSKDVINKLQRMLTKVTTEKTKAIEEKSRIATSMEQLENDISVWAQLPNCGHSFCHPCLKGQLLRTYLHLRDNADDPSETLCFRCAECRTPITGDIMPNFSLQNVINCVPKAAVEFTRDEYAQRLPEDPNPHDNGWRVGGVGVDETRLSAKEAWVYLKRQRYLQWDEADEIDMEED